MLKTKFHISDEELVRFADGELSLLRAARVRSHLAACWDCRVRVGDLEGTIAKFVRMHHESLDPLLPPISGARVRLQAQLAESEHQPHPETLHQPQSSHSALRVGLSFAFCLLAVAGIVAWRSSSTQRHFARSFHTNDRYDRLLPDRRLTPGATRSVQIREICSMAHDQVIRPVSTELQGEVLEEYQLRDASLKNYELDYLITPGLGGADDIRNVWPQPRYTAVWNSFAKDQLDDRLHQLVCSDQLSLAEAQQEVASDWISAYKKYFHANAPAL